ncbi:MAG: hypothetical protein QOI07_2998 [Verrucomicrobiota bacterium]|jgi:hypothetical protein
MSSETKEILDICESLSAEKRTAVAEFARFLLSNADDERWEQLIADPTRRPKLEAYVRESASEGDEPMNLKRL